MIVRGEAYMVMEKIVAAKPQNYFLLWPWRTTRETNATAANAVMTRTRMEKIFVFSFLGAKLRKISTYMNSIAAPVPLIVDTGRLCGDTKGSPYLFNSSSRRLSIWAEKLPMLHDERVFEENLVIKIEKFHFHNFRKFWYWKKQQTRIQASAKMSLKQSFAAYDNKRIKSSMIIQFTKQWIISRSLIVGDT